ncbi:hypothetical protein HanXRQr2_Chr17g0817431 [Helianthus annuus]|uniref:Uncharacterized protein n=1 Tax=Helianthus annuus TaxID=4232 RepID=A0A9K3DJZ0_HELAN|nr:hypothetical protein HanXRQr2_Chr17g0817431 [Helianthus annuus]KAJ0814379.1 hypothetical protein HanPSC8_Chr17g0785021 [Helianthus annuus]
MGFWPYFLHAQESEGGAFTSLLSRDLSISFTGTETTRFCNERLLRWRIFAIF